MYSWELSLRERALADILGSTFFRVNNATTLREIVGPSGGRETDMPAPGYSSLFLDLGRVGWSISATR